MTTPLREELKAGEVPEPFNSLGFKISKTRYGWGGGNLTKFDGNQSTTITPDHAQEIVDLISRREREAVERFIETLIRLYGDQSWPYFLKDEKEELILAALQGQGQGEEKWKS